jgi:prolyl-tRNA synthetase
MRGREFIMKDAYSFDRDEASAKASYQLMADAYRKIFDRFGLRYRAVAADSGAIGGDLSEEFQVIAATGEDAIIYCPNSDYAANIEKAESLAPAPRSAAMQPMAKMPTPGSSTCEAVAAVLNVPLQKTVKSLVIATEELNQKGEVVKTQIWLLMVRGDHSLNETKANKVEGLKNGFRFATEGEIVEHFGCKPGYLGPINMKKPVKIVADREVVAMADWICGANEMDFHITGVNWGRDLPEPHQIADIRNVLEGDPSPDGKGALAIERGIEIGHVFYLGTKYSKAMKATFLDIDGKPKHFEMGCYGIGITRLPAAAVEQNHDGKGIIWPDALAPFTVVICPVGADRFPNVKEASDAIYDELIAKGVDVILDDRGERPGAMFADWELIGVPHRITVGDKSLRDGQVEYQHRRDEVASPIPVANAVAHVLSKLTA